MVTKAATTTSCTTMRMRLGMVLRMSEIITFEKAVITVTARPITMAGFNWLVTASAEQMPSTCTSIGWSRLSGLVNASLFCLLNSAIVYIKD